MPENGFFEFEIKSNMLCIGERIKRSTYRPCITTLPCSTVMGALKTHLCRENIWAVGVLERWAKEKTTLSPQDVSVGSTREQVAPLFVEYLTDVQGKIFVWRGGDTKKLEDITSSLTKGEEGYFKLAMGGLKSKGFGDCLIKFTRLLDGNDLKPVKGKLRTRLYKDEETLKVFGISETYKPYYGYLFKPTSLYDGYYQLSLFEGSIVKGYNFLVEEER